MNKKNFSSQTLSDKKSKETHYPLINSYFQNAFKVENEIFKGPIIIFKNKVINWKISNKNISILDFEIISKLKYKPEFILFGSGKTYDDPEYQLRSDLQRKKITIDIMPTHSACRVWNLIVYDNRNIAGFFMPII